MASNNTNQLNSAGHKRPREGEEVDNAAPIPPLIPMCNAELIALVDQLQERFMLDLWAMEGVLKGILAEGTAAPPPPPPAQASDAASAAAVVAGNASSSPSTIDRKFGGGDDSGGIIGSSGELKLRDDLFPQAQAAQAVEEDDGLLLTADMLFGDGDAEEKGGEQDEGGLLFTLPNTMAMNANLLLSSSSAALPPTPLPPLDELIGRIQQGLRSRAGLMVLVDMVLQLQQERAEMLRMKAHLVRSLDTVDSMLAPVQNSDTAATDGTEGK